MHSLGRIHACAQRSLATRESICRGAWAQGACDSGTLVASVLAMSMNGQEFAPTGDHQARDATRWAVLLLCVAAAVTMLPLWEPLLLAAFVAVVAEPLYLRLYRRIDGRASSAALIT